MAGLKAAWWAEMRDARTADVTVVRLAALLGPLARKLVAPTAAPTADCWAL